MTVAIDNERTKLSANSLVRSSTACPAVGIFAPLAALLQGQTPIPVLGVAMSFVGWLAAVMIVLHVGARRMLGGLTTGWVIFGILMPAIVAGIGWIAVLANERYLRKQEHKRAKPAE